MKKITKNILSGSDVGKERKDNQDRFYCFDDNKWGNGVSTFIAIADGMGGLNDGGKAAEIALDCIKQNLSDIDFKNPFLTNDFIFEVLYNSTIKANEEVCSYSKKNNTQMGTTLSFGILIRDTFYFSHIGDTRIYSIKESSFKKNNYSIEQLTVDDNVEGSSNILTQHIGSEKEISPFLGKFKISKTSFLLFASDGLYGLVEDQKIAEFFASYKGDVLPKKLIDEANNNGGNDNITLVIYEPKVIEYI